MYRRQRALGQHPSGSIAVFLLVVVVVVTGLGIAGWFYFRSTSSGETEDAILRAVTRGPFEHIVLEQGQVESSRNVEIRCQVKSQSAGGTEILWVIDEGTFVNEGDKLVVLDSSSLEQERVQQQIVCNTSKALVIQAENTLRAAEIARTEYLEGSFKQDEQTILSEIFVAEENLRRAQLAFQSTERLAAKGIVTALQLEGDQFAVDKAKNELETAQTKLMVIRKYTKAKNLKQFDSDIATAEAKWEAEKESYRLELEKLDEIVEQIERCTIYAPDSGQVVYANIFSHRGGSAEFVVEAGASVRERQEIIRLPDSTNMQVKATINESRISLVEAGMPAAIEFDAIRDQTLEGEVTKVNQYAEPGSWSSGNVKEYAAFISIFDPPPEVRSGMNAEVRIYVDQQDNALQVPVQALYETKGHYFCLVKDGDRWETREIQRGASNDNFMTIKSGLEEGEMVVMNPRAYPHRLEIPDLPDPDPAASRNGKRKNGSSRKGPPGNGNQPPAEEQADSPRDTDAEPSDENPDVARGPAGSGGPGGSGGFDPSRVFTMLDSDGDGTISAEELAAMPEDRRGRMAESDADGDGAVTRQEFMEAISRRNPSGGGASGAERGRP